MNHQNGLTSVYLVLFLMSLSLHIQFPIFTPFAVELGATTFFVSLIISSSSLTSFAGHLVAGPLIDQFGKKRFIVLALFCSAFFIFCYTLIHRPIDLLLLRVLNAIVLSFMGPACLSLLSAYARNSREQGKNMALNGLMITLANIIAPILGGKLNTLVGYKGTFLTISGCLVIAGVIALIFIRDADAIVVHRKGEAHFKAILKKPGFIPLLIVGFALMYGNGTLFFELPFLSVEQGLSTAETGKLFSIMGVGTLAVLLLFGLNRISALFRTLVGLMLLSLIYFQMATGIGHLHLATTLFCAGAVFGLLFPALTTLVSERVGKAQYGSAFGILSSTFSLGIILSALLSGAVRHAISPYFLAFLVLIAAATYIFYDYLKHRSPTATFNQL